MAGDRFDTSALSEHPSGPNWKRFRAEAIAGEHGKELASVRWWGQAGRFVLAAFLVVAAVTVPAVLLVQDGLTASAVATSALVAGGCVVLGFAVLWVPRAEAWRARARVRYRLTEFARRNGLDYEHEPATALPATRIFESGLAKGRHLDRVVVADPEGFTIENYEEDTPELSSDESGYAVGYAVFRLRQSYPHTVIGQTTRPWSGSRALRDIKPIDGPNRTRLWSINPEHPPLRQLLEETAIVEQSLGITRWMVVEIVGDNLFLLQSAGLLPIGSPRLWRTLSAISGSLAPFLAAESSDHIRQWA